MTVTATVTAPSRIPTSKQPERGLIVSASQWISFPTTVEQARRQYQTEAPSSGCLGRAEGDERHIHEEAMQISVQQRAKTKTRGRMMECVTESDHSRILTNSSARPT